MSVSSLLEQTSSAELTEWKAYYTLMASPEVKPQTVAEAKSVLSAMAKKRKK
jgi:hypothetical protein